MDSDIIGPSGNTPRGGVVHDTLSDVADNNGDRRAPWLSDVPWGWVCRDCRVWRRGDLRFLIIGLDSGLGYGILQCRFRRGREDLIGRGGCGKD